MFIYERVYGIPQAVAYLLENGMTIHWLYIVMTISNLDDWGPDWATLNGE